MARPRRIDDDAILAAAREVFLSQGANAPLTAVAAACGLSQPAISQRFGSRAQLVVRALTPRGVEAWVALWRAPVPPGGARAALERLAVEGIVLLAEAFPAVIAMRAAALDFPPGPAPHEVVEEAARDWFDRAAAAGALSPGNSSARAITLLGALQTVAMRGWLQPDRQRDPDEVKAIVEALWTGLRPLTEPPT